MAHEFKTPLTLIKGATTSLLSNPGQPVETRTEQLRTADEEADHLRELIDDSVEMARLDTARIDVRPEISDLKETLQEVLTSMQAEIEDHPVRVTYDPQLPPLTFDRRLMKLAIKQLVDNAVKYSPAENPVEIGLHRKDGAVAVDITDFGKGIPPEEQKRVFERFYRSPAIKDQIPGSGLGLSIAHSIVKAHGGELGVRSEIGRTTFRITLPALKEQMA
jgi:two-component system OmpR family sensor kinase